MIKNNTLTNLKSEIYKKVRTVKFESCHAYPPYDIWKECMATIPETYNAEGRRYDYYYLRDIHCAADPYGGTGKYFIWDRYNYGLPIHFYSHNEMLVNIGKPVKKYGLLLESRSIVPKDYSIFSKNKGLATEFDKIFTFDDEMLNSLPNAAFFQIAASPTYGIKGGFVYDGDNYLKKCKDVSILASNKVMTPIHMMRAELARYCKKNNLCDAFGRAVSNEYVDIDIPYKDYRFAITIENDRTDYYFTEKIINCFASQTIPLYYGAKRISEFFNPDGIITITESDIEHPENILKMCTREEYESRIPAILDNYKRVIDCYMNMQDYLYEKYLCTDRK